MPPGLHMSELMPCPFCGGEADRTNSDGGAYEWCRCNKCGAQGPHINYNREGLGASQEYWNTRTHVPAVCPYIVTSPDTAEGGEGTSYCRLAESQSRAASPASAPTAVDDSMLIGMLKAARPD